MAAETIPEIRALTVQQPFAWAIAYAGKDVENRPWRTAWRGLVAIHAGLDMHPGHFPARTDEGLAAARALDKLGGRNNVWNPRHLVKTSLGPVHHPGLALGAVIAVAVIAGCHHESTEQPANSCSPWGMPGQFHWQLARVRPLAEPVPCRGRQRLWRLPGDVEKAVRAQLETQ
jgi:hypothetical protein